MASYPSVRQLKNWFKWLLAFVLAFVFVFSSWASVLQPRTLSNVTLATIILTPATTVGNFLDTSFVLLITVCVSSAIWAFIQGVAGTSYVAMTVVMFLVVYSFSVLRAMYPARFFVPSLVAPIFAYTAIASVVGVNGKNTSGGIFDYHFLISTINANLIGIAICFAINVLVFPDFATPHIHQHFISILIKISSLLKSIFGAMSGAEHTKALYDEGVKSRDGIVAGIKGDLSVIEMTINQASAEVSYSHYSIKDYTQLLRNIKGLSAILFSLNTSLKSSSSQKLLSSPEFLDNIAPAMKDTWDALAATCVEILEDIESKFGEVVASKERSHTPDMEMALQEKFQTAARKTQETMAAFQNHRPNEFLDIFADESIHDGVPMKLREGWEKLVQVTFHMLASREVVKELVNLHSTVHCKTGKRLHIRFHFKHFLPSFIFDLLHYRKPSGKVATLVPRKTINQGLVAIKNFLLSPPSIFGLKLATAIFCYLMVMYSQPVVFQQWSMGGAFVTILVAVSPSLGQTYSGLPAQIITTTIGSSIAYGGISAFGRDGAYGLTAFAAILGIPSIILMSKPQTLIIGLLIFMSFSNAVVAGYANRANPAFPAPHVALYRGVVISAVTLAFCLIFTVVLYPTLARHVIRTRMFEIFRDFSMYYRRIIVSTVNVHEGAETPIEDSDLNDIRNGILSKLVSLEPLMVFAASEPRLEGRFPSAKYRAVINCMYPFLDRLEALRVSGGGQPFDKEVRDFLNFGALGEVRLEMQQTIRILSYIFASALLTKQRLPPTLPNATRARERLFVAFIRTLMDHVHGRIPVNEDPLVTMPKDKLGVLNELNTERWLRLLSFSASAREVSRELDAFGALMKDIFGEFPDINPHDPSKDISVIGDGWLVAEGTR
ncbi:hypothetical protein BC830DRAFT_338499 [Chytriomyces sp. MP71]|nr:hypothetical protein BC830DRAFT_338499 [Chytriomyces sp. MP71]